MEAEEIERQDGKIERWGGREAEEIGERRGRIKRGRETEGSKGKSWGRAMEDMRENYYEGLR
jgi:hypothetical protein